MTASSSKPRRWHSPRFSLAGLLLFMTAVAVAVWIWTQPYVEVTDLPGAFGGKLSTTWKRTLTGGRVRHGQERLTTNQWERTQNYRDGELDGPYHAKMADGSETKGQFAHGQRVGEWTTRNGSGEIYTTDWRGDRLDGVVEIHSAGGTTIRHVFARDRLLDEDGQPIDFPLLSDQPGEAPSERVVAGLHDFTQLEFVEMPLRDVAAFLTDFHQVPIRLAPSISDAEMPVTQNLRDIRLIHALQIMAEEANLTGRYHDGAIWLEPRGER